MKFNPDLPIEQLELTDELRRDLFAMCALIGFMSNAREAPIKHLVEWSWETADEMLAQRQK